MSPRAIGFLIFFATLLLYVAATVIADRPDLIWDEARYKWFATSLTQGTYCTPEKPDVINGPGYPLVLAPLIAAGAPLIVLRGLNALFMALAALFSFRAVLPYAGQKWALGVSLLTALLLPPTLVTGFFGMNTGGLPFAAEDHGTALAFAAMAGAAIAVFIWLQSRGFFKR